MPLKYYPRAGQLLVCDFSGFEPPEMVKKRPVVIVSPKLPYRSDIVTVVPISLTPPRHQLPFVVKLSKNYHPQEDENLDCWAKCDMLLNISISRLDGFKVARRKWVNPQISGDDLMAIKHGVIYGLGMGHLLP